MDPKKQKIAEAAHRLFLRHGFRKVTISDIAEACEMSRPSLYAAFANKEAVLGDLVNRQREELAIETAKRLQRKKNLKDRLEIIFGTWILEPFASVIDSENAIELLSMCASYVPDAIGDLYAHFERQLLEVLEPEMKGRRSLTAADLAHIMALATKGLKTSSASLAELRRMTDGLIAMALSAVR
ncbi:MAG TPA: helix-turn-helix domain-containing protein [Thermoanaerobaculia bacterium]|jgi:AcrR family transcriptional regulator|nr:helix-turn-helix domain-containing protein [Thermoanaerobaculia bacterium]